MTRTILLIITAMIIARIGSSETWISVKNKSIRLTDTSSCRNIAEKDEQTACDCCLIKRSVIEGLGTANAFDACERSKHCRVDENADVMEQNPYVALKTAKTRLKAMTIVRIERLLKPPKLPKDGVLSSTDVGAILKSLHANGHLPLPSPLFADNKVLKIKPLSNSAKGFWSGQLFSIQYDAYYVDPEVTETGTFRPL
ncbi:MAG TPA: hypothetical protein VEL47_01295, partial [Myxococcota bacterium]|nr:hypothetical protein [Myxococcota bacterium]